MTIDDVNVSRSRLLLGEEARLSVDGGQPVDVDGRVRARPGVPFLATDFEVEPGRWLPNPATPEGVVRFLDPRGASGVWEGGLGDDVSDGNGESCSVAYPSAARGLDPGCTALEVFSANLERFLIARDQIGRDASFDPPETALELRSILEGDLALGDPLAGPDGVLFANWIAEPRFDPVTGKRLGLYGFRSDVPDPYRAPLDVAATTSTDPLVRVYQKAIVAPTFIANVYDPSLGESLANQCFPDLSRAIDGYCYLALTPAVEGRRILGVLPVGMLLSEVALPGPGETGTLIVEAGLARVAAEGECATRSVGSPCLVARPLVLPLQTLDALDLLALERIAGVCLGTGRFCDQLPTTRISYRCPQDDADCLTAAGADGRRRAVHVMERHQQAFGGFISATPTGPLSALDNDGNLRPDLDENADRALDLYDDGTVGPASDDAFLCGNGLPGDALDQVLQYDLSHAELEVLDRWYPDGFPRRSPVYCGSLMRLLGATGLDASGERQFLWQIPATADDADPDRDGVPRERDNCPWAFNPLQEDSGGRADSGEEASGPDGRGDACTCGDVDADGRIGPGDVDVYRRWLGNDRRFPTDFPRAKCDLGGSPECTIADLARLSAAVTDPALQLPARCAAARPTAGVASAER